MTTVKGIAMTLVILICNERPFDLFVIATYTQQHTCTLPHAAVYFGGDTNYVGNCLVPTPLLFLFLCVPRWFQESAVKRNIWVVLLAWGLVFVGIGEFVFPPSPLAKLVSLYGGH